MPEENTGTMIYEQRVKASASVHQFASVHQASSAFGMKSMGWEGMDLSEYLIR